MARIAEFSKPSTFIPKEGVSVAQRQGASVSRGSDGIAEVSAVTPLNGCHLLDSVSLRTRRRVTWCFRPYCPTAGSFLEVHMKKRFFFTLILALTLLMAIGASAPRTGSCAAGDQGACRQACDNAFNACLANGLSFHQCLGDLHRCNKGCQ